MVEQAEQLREQFTRADNEKKELARKLEEAQGRLEENELARKKLQGKLESLNRQLEEGQGDKERLVEQLESLRGQVAKSEREKDEIMQQAMKLTRNVTQRRQSIGPGSSGPAQLRRSFSRSEGAGGDHLSEMRRTLDRFELERDLDRRSHFGDSFYDGMSGRNTRGVEDMDRLDMLHNLEALHQDMDRKDEQQERLIGQMRDLLTKYEDSEEQKKRYANELEAVNKKLKEAMKDVQELEGQLHDKENQLKDSDRKRTELRNKALQSIKEYRTKCKRLEREAEQGIQGNEPVKELREIKELRGKIAQLVMKLQEEAQQRQNIEERILEARQQERATKEEAASLYAQLQQVCAKHFYLLQY
ncbi:PREDICTED: tropomyosin-2-like [Acropora digitifera]|uniref:tropomyosin-2-like n=1 Tax=Acropora digitifera TaxID=70779 RepID=UPI00077ACC03|nr:PREDICTED: tropomyosin-2-like [Acropora digitifera]